MSAGLMHLLLAEKHPSAYLNRLPAAWVVINGVTESIDSVFVRTASGFIEERKNITPICFLKMRWHRIWPRVWNKSPIDIDLIKDRLQYLKGRYEWIIAEGAGGLAVPLNDEGYMQ